MPDIPIEKILKQFQKLKVLIIGDVMIDSYLWGKADRISPEAPVPIVFIENTEYRLGGAANVALNIKSLGATPILCSVIGKNEDSDIFLDLLSKHKINSDGIIRGEQRKTTVKSRIFSRNQQMLRFDKESDHILNKSETNRLILSIFHYLKDVDVVIFQDYDKGVIHPLVIKTVMTECQKHRIPVAVDPKMRNFHEYKNATLFKPNLREIESGLELKVDIDDRSSLLKAALALNKSLKNKFTLLTLASRGIYIHSENHDEIIPSAARNVADVSGAGDTVISIAALGLAAGIDFTINAQIANIAAGLVCSEVGIIPVNCSELIREVQAFSV